MNKYTCPECNGNQYSSSSNEACIYCGNPEVELIIEKDGGSNVNE